MTDTKRKGIRAAGAAVFFLATMGVGVAGGGVLGTLLTGPAETMQLPPYCEDDICRGFECTYDFPGLNCDQEFSYCVSSVCMP